MEWGRGEEGGKRDGGWGVGWRVGMEMGRELRGEGEWGGAQRASGEAEMSGE